MALVVPSYTCFGDLTRSRELMGGVIPLYLFGIVSDRRQYRGAVGGGWGASRSILANVRRHPESGLGLMKRSRSAKPGRGVVFAALRNAQWAKCELCGSTANERT